jgi:hypothetical protein
MAAITNFIFRPRLQSPLQTDVPESSMKVKVVVGADAWF